MENIELQYSNNGFLMQGIHNGQYLDKNEISKVIFNALEGENLPPEASSPELLGNILRNFSEGWLKPIQSVLGRKGINFTVKGDSYQYNLREDKMTNENLRMQMLSGVITESEYKTKLEELNAAESKDSLNEHYVAGGIVGIGAITQIPSREKTDYELAFEHFLGERYLTKFENREQDPYKMEEGKEEEDLDEGKEVEEPSLYEEEVSMNGGQSISQIQDEWLQVTTDIARLAAEYKKPKPDMQAALALGDQLKAKARLKQKLENEINNSIAGNDRDIRLIITQLT
jgi:hypothetical protein